MPWKRSSRWVWFTIVYYVIAILNNNNNIIIISFSVCAALFTSRMRINSTTKSLFELNEHNCNYGTLKKHHLKRSQGSVFCRKSFIFLSKKTHAPRHTSLVLPGHTHHSPTPSLLLTSMYVLLFGLNWLLTRCRLILNLGMAWSWRIMNEAVDSIIIISEFVSPSLLLFMIWM